MKPSLCWHLAFAFFWGFSAQILPAQPNLIRNGSFEQYVGPGINPLYWNSTVVPNSILFAADGRWAIALTHFLADPTTQAVPTVPGTQYELRFASREPVFGSDEFEGSATQLPDGTWVPDGPWVVDVSLNGAFMGGFENDHTNIWQYFTLDFTANASTTVVGFYAGAAGSPLLDDVSLRAVPEPSPLWLGMVGTILVQALYKRAFARP